MIIGKGIKITPKKNGMKFEAKKVTVYDMARALAAIAYNLKDKGVSYADILKTVDAGVDGSAFNEVRG